MSTKLWSPTVSTDPDLDAVFAAIRRWYSVKSSDAPFVVVDRAFAEMARLVIALKYPDGPDDGEAA